MYAEKTTITNPSGLHARPAATFAKMAATFEAKVTIANLTKGKAPADAASMIAIMVSAIQTGDEVEVCADGTDEREAVAALVQLLADGCGE